MKTNIAVILTALVILAGEGLAHDAAAQSYQHLPPPPGANLGTSIGPVGGYHPPASLSSGMDAFAARPQPAVPERQPGLDRDIYGRPCIAKLSDPTCR